MDNKPPISVYSIHLWYCGRFFPGFTRSVGGFFRYPQATQGFNTEMFEWLGWFGVLHGAPQGNIPLNKAPGPNALLATVALAQRQPKGLKKPGRPVVGPSSLWGSLWAYIGDSERCDIGCVSKNGPSKWFLQVIFSRGKWWYTIEEFQGTEIVRQNQTGDASGRLEIVNSKMDHTLGFGTCFLWGHWIMYLMESGKHYGFL